MEQTKIHIGVYGIVYIDNKLLVIKKSRGEYTGLLDLPGGTPEFFESFEETLRREMIEETGLIVRKYEILPPMLNIGTFGEVILRHIGIMYKITEFSGSIKTLSDGQDSNGCQLIGNATEGICTPFVRKILGS